MVKEAVPTLEVSVVGDQGSGKENFINRFLSYYPSSAEIHRKNDATHFIYKPGGEVKIQLHDINNVGNIDGKFHDQMDVIFFCYAANDPESLQSLEKWIGLTRDKVKKGADSCVATEKDVRSFIVADLSNSGSRHDVAENLAQKAKKLKEIFGMKRLIEISFEDEESASKVFQQILKEIMLQKLKENSSRNEFWKESLEKCFNTYLTERFSYDLPKPCLDEAYSLGFLNVGDGGFEDSFEKLHLKNSICISSRKSRNYFPYQLPNKLKNNF